MGVPVGILDVHRFPDGEVLVRLDTDPGSRDVALVCTLARPDDKTLPVLFAAGAARAQAARSVGLIAPYLPYLRQDRVFHAGEALTSATFAATLSGHLDWLVSVDPHLHRYRALTDVYALNAQSVSASSEIAAWIGRNVTDAVLIGPDEESAQWVSAIAAKCDVPCTTLTKERFGDRSVKVTLPPDLARWHGRTPVLVDDIVSTGRTMREALKGLAAAGMPGGICVATHAIFAGDAYGELLAAGAARVVTTNTVPHESNAIDVTAAVAAAVGRMGREAADKVA
jgi:ribose-phosphate pyrophosphokinase